MSDQLPTQHTTNIHNKVIFNRTGPGGRRGVRRRFAAARLLGLGGSNPTEDMDVCLL